MRMNVSFIKRNKTPLFFSLCICIVLFFNTTGFSQEIKWYSTDQGGGISADNTGDIELTGVIGQIDVTRMKGGNLSLSGGYLPIPPLPELLFKDSFE